MNLTANTQFKVKGNSEDYYHDFEIGEVVTYLQPYSEGGYHVFVNQHGTEQALHILDVELIEN